MTFQWPRKVAHVRFVAVLRQRGKSRQRHDTRRRQAVIHHSGLPRHTRTNVASVTVTDLGVTCYPVIPKSARPQRNRYLISNSSVTWNYSGFDAVLKRNDLYGSPSSPNAVSALITDSGCISSTDPLVPTSQRKSARILTFSCGAGAVQLPVHATDIERCVPPYFKYRSTIMALTSFCVSVVTAKQDHCHRHQRVDGVVIYYICK